MLCNNKQVSQQPVLPKQKKPLYFLCFPLFTEVAYLANNPFAGSQRAQQSEQYLSRVGDNIAI